MLIPAAPITSRIAADRDTIPGKAEECLFQVCMAAPGLGESYAVLAHDFYLQNAKRSRDEST
jgi:hypothetical protein